MKRSELIAALMALPGEDPNVRIFDVNKHEQDVDDEYSGIHVITHVSLALDDEQLADIRLNTDKPDYQNWIALDFERDIAAEELESIEKAFIAGFKACDRRISNGVLTVVNSAMMEDLNIYVDEINPNINPKKPSFEQAVEPLMKYMAENHHPHTMVIVDSDSAQLLEGQKTHRTDKFILD